MERFAETVGLAVSAPLRLWRHPNGKPIYLLTASLFALWAGWVFTFMVTLWASYMWWMLLGDN